MSQTDSQDHLLSRAPPPDYLEDWTKLIEEPPLRRPAPKGGSILVFRLEKEILSLPSQTIKLISEMKKSHGIPNNPFDFVQGLVNIQGQLKLLFSLHDLLQIPKKTKANHHRMILTEHEGEEALVSCDELLGVFPYDPSSIKEVIDSSEAPYFKYLKGFLPSSESTQIALLDISLLFSSLRKKLYGG